MWTGVANAVVSGCDNRIVVTRISLFLGDTGNVLRKDVS